MSTKIGWTGDTENPTIGCTKKSAGCKNCYAISEAWKLMHNPNPAIRKKYEGVVEKSAAGSLNWTGRINFDFSVLKKAVANKKPTLYFVNSMSDLFHPNLSFETIDIIFSSFAASPHHRYQVLTKHPDRALEWFNWENKQWINAGMQGSERIRYLAHHNFDKQIHPDAWKWPLPNVSIGTSTEDQDAANERIKYLMKIPAVIRFISAEPLLGPIDFTNKGIKNGYSIPTRYDANRRGIEWTDPGDKFIGVHQIIVGGESGNKPGIRPMHPDWVRSIRDQCQASGVPFFFKQWGAWLPFQETAQSPFWRACNDGEEFDAHGMNMIDDETGEAGVWDMEPGGRKYRWYDTMDSVIISVEQGGQQVNWLRTGKKLSGNLLDGQKYEEFPAGWGLKA